MNAVWTRRPMALRLCLAGQAVALLLAGGLVGQEPPKAGPDLAKGFEVLVRLGLPDTKGWEYVNWKAGDGGYGDYMMGSGGLEDYRPSGNAWLEPAPGEGGLRRLVRQGVKVSAVVPPAIPEGEQAKLRDLAAQAGLPLATGVPEPVDAAADAASLVAALVKFQETKQEHEVAFGLYRSMTEYVAAAAHHHRQGRATEASRIMETLFSLAPSREMVLGLAVQGIASERQQRAMTKLEKTGDWAAAERDLAALLADFPRVWQERPLAERLLAQIKTRASGEVPGLNSTPELPLTPEQAEWWKGIAAHQPDREAGPETAHAAYRLSHAATLAGQAWLSSRLGWSGGGRRGWDTEPAGEGLFPLNNGWDWLAVMAAALGDETPTLVGFQAERMGGPDVSFLYGRGRATEVEELSESELAQKWSYSFPRPKTRNDLAREFLLHILPEFEEEGGGASIEEEAAVLREAALKWRDKIAGKSQVEVAKFYLHEGGYQHQEMAASVIAEKGEETDLAELEELVLGAPSEGQMIAHAILGRRKAQGAAFFQKYKARYLEEVAKQRKESGRFDGFGGESAKVREKQYQEQDAAVLGALEDLVSEKGFETLVAELVESGVAFRQAYQRLESHLEEVTREEVEILFAALLKIPEAEGARRNEVLQLASQAAWKALQEEEKGDPSEGSEAEDGEPGGRTEPLPPWLLDCFRKVVTGSGTAKVPFGAETIPVADSARLMLARLSDADGGFQTKLAGLPRLEVNRFLVDRGQSLLDGKSPAPMPDAADVPEARRKEIEAGLAKVGTAEWAPFVAGLSLAEKCVLRDALASDGAGESRAKAAGLVSEVSFPEGRGEAMAEKWAGLKGASLDAAGAQRLLSVVQESVAESGKALSGWVEIKELSLGLRLALWESTWEEGEPGDFSGQQRFDPIALFLSNFDAEAERDYTAIVFFGWQSREGRNCMIRLRGNDGQWKPHTGAEAPAGLGYLPFGQALEDGELEPKLAELAKVLSSPVPMVRIHFGGAVLPKPGAAETEEKEAGPKEAP